MFGTFYIVRHWIHALVFTIWEIVRVMTFYSARFRFLHALSQDTQQKIDSEVVMMLSYENWFLSLRRGGGETK